MIDPIATKSEGGTRHIRNFNIATKDRKHLFFKTETTMKTFFLKV